MMYPRIVLQIYPAQLALEIVGNCQSCSYKTTRLVTLVPCYLMSTHCRVRGKKAASMQFPYESSLIQAKKYREDLFKVIVHEH